MRHHNDLPLLSAEEVERVYRVTDELLLNRDWVVVPLNCSADGLVMMMPDGKILLRPPEGERFAPWLASLKDQLETLDLKRVPRVSNVDPKRDLTGLYGERFVGTRTYLPPEVANVEPAGEPVKPWPQEKKKAA